MSKVKYRVREYNPTSAQQGKPKKKRQNFTQRSRKVEGRLRLRRRRWFMFTLRLTF